MESQCGWKPPIAICLYLLLIRNSFYNDFVLVQSFTSMQATTCRELQLSLLFSSLSWKGATTHYFFSFKDHFSLISRLYPRTSKTHQLPKPTRIEICKYFLITLQLLHKTYPDHNMCKIKHASIIQTQIIRFIDQAYATYHRSKSYRDTTIPALRFWPIKRTYLWSMVVSPWYLNLWFWTMVPRQKCWSQVLGSWYCVIMVLDRGIVKGLRL